MEFEYRKEHQYFTSACLNLTDACNLACRYCFVQQKPHYMSLDTAKKAIDFIVNNYKLCPEKGKPHISFFGGEPTLLWDEIIVPIVLWSEEKYPDLISFFITTNGTLLNKQRILFLKEHNIIPLLSIDGSEETQNYNRPCKDGSPSFPLVFKNIPLILEHFPYTTFRATINQDTCNKVFDTYLFALSTGFKNIFLCPNAREDWTTENINILTKEMEKIFIHQINSYQNGNAPLYFSLIDKIFNKILDHDLQVFNKKDINPEVKRNAVRCGLGSGSASIAYDGKIYGCQEQDSRDTNDFFYIGNIETGIDIEKHKALLTEYAKKTSITCSNKNKCNYCLLRNVCINDICPSVSWDRFKNFHIRPEIDCIFSNILLKNCRIMMEILVKENNELFKQYLSNLYKKEWGI